MKIKNIFLPVFLIFCSSSLLAQEISIERLEPEFWWTGFEETELQLLVYGENIGDARADVEYPGVRLLKTVTTENPNYLFVYLDITDNIVPGTMPLHFRRGDRTQTINYELKMRQGSENRHLGFDSSDVIYLLMPDRFANGDLSNDEIPGMIEGVDMEEPFARKGGDIKGITDNLEYIRDLGMTAIWLNPIFENDMPYDYSENIGFYHGYAATDMYKVDRRFGSNEEFVEMIKKSHDLGLKVIMDKIHNHVGTHHWFVKDLPSSDWVHKQDVHGNTNFRTNTIMDPYASKADLNSTVKGWFVDEMPDLNQRNELVADYLIQNTIWWIEYSGIDGIRMDTHPYPYQDYMAEWTRRVLEEYPDFNIVGEAWMPNAPTTAWWQFDSILSGDYNSYLPSVTDFPLYFALVAGINEEAGWDTGFARLYYTLGQDFLYTDPFLNVIFFDNHDLTRFMTTVGENPDKFRLGIVFILTTRGIPQIYYGSEIMETGGIHDPDKRKPFPGGWPGHEIDAFTEEGRKELGAKRNLPIPEMFNYLKKLSQWRAEKEVIHSGKLTHFIPENNLYVYFRHNENESVMVILNGLNQRQQIDPARFKERLAGFTEGREVVSGKRINIEREFLIEPMEAIILELE